MEESNSSDICQCDNVYNDTQIINHVQFVLEGLGIPLVGTLGLLGNIAAIIVLRYVK